MCKAERVPQLKPWKVLEFILLVGSLLQSMGIIKINGEVEGKRVEVKV
jgi:hypothetical protein